MAEQDEKTEKEAVMRNGIRVDIVLLMSSVYREMREIISVEHDIDRVTHHPRNDVRVLII